MNQSDKNQSKHHDGEMGNWAPFYDLMIKCMTLGRERKLREMTVDFVPVKAGDNVLDLGCGTGTLTLVAKKRAGVAGEVCGIDVTPEMIEIAKRKASRTAHDVRFEVGSIDDIPFPDEKFDAVLCSFMMHHVPPEIRQKGASEIMRVLKNDGRLLILDFRKPRLCTELLTLLEKAGFQDINIEAKKIGILSRNISAIHAVASKNA